MEHIQVYNPSNGQPYATTPTPKTSSGTIDIDDNSNKIATTEWTQAAFGSCVRSVNETEPDSNGNVRIFVRNVGDEWFSYTGKTPPGGVPYLGQLVNRDTFPALWEYVQNNNLVKTETEWQELDTSQNGNVPFYSDGDGSTTFRMPKVVGYIKGTNDIDGAGVYTAEGLPDPTLDFLYRKDSTSSGVFQEIYGNDGYTDASPSSTSGTDEYMQSSLAFGKTTPYAVITTNNIYGNSDHVTPETVTVLFGVYAYGEVNLQGSTITVDQLASEITGIEKRFNSIPHIIKTWTSSDGKSWYRKYSDGWIEQGGLMSTSSTVTFHVAFSDTNYYVDVTWNGGKSQTFYPSDWNITKSSNTYFTTTATTNANNVHGLCWYACGY